MAFRTALNFEVWTKPKLLKNKCRFHTWFPLVSYHFPHSDCFQRLLFVIITVIAMHSFLFASVHLAVMAERWQIGKKNSGMWLHLSFNSWNNRREPYAGQTLFASSHRADTDRLFSYTNDSPMLWEAILSFLSFKISELDTNAAYLIQYAIKRPFIKWNQSLNTSENYIWTNRSIRKHYSFKIQKKYPLG